MADEPGAPDLRPGPLRSGSDPEASAEELSTLKMFCDLHEVPSTEVRCASLLDPAGRRHGLVLVVPMERLRRLAESTGKFARRDPPQFERDGEGLPAAATVRIFRTDLPRGLARTAFWHERVPSSPEAPGAARWMLEPDTVMAELAESLALRAAFPQALEGVYTEMDLPEATRDHELRRVHSEADLRRALRDLR